MFGLRITTIYLHPIVAAIGISFALSAEAAEVEHAMVQPVDLRCEYLVDPLDVDTTSPRFSWQLKLNKQNSTLRNIRQTSYRILVASKPEHLQPGMVDLWDSGRQLSDISINLPYRGKPLQTGRQAFWTVIVTTSAEEKATIASPAQFRMGMLKPEDWTGQWIGTNETFTRREGWPPPDNEMPDPWLRKTFTLDNRPTDAIIHVASIGYHELYINGRKADDTVLAPCVSDHTQRARYVTYDITKLLDQGKNVIALWLGTSWSIFPPYKIEGRPQTPVVIAQCEITDSNDTTKRRTIVTDASWKTHPSPNTLLGVWDFMHYGGESYDANKEIGDWNQTSLDDSSWDRAVVYDIKVQLSAHTVEPNRIKAKLQAIDVEKLDDGSCRVDLGKNFAGWTEIKVKGKPGTKVEFQFSEVKSERMTHRHRSEYIIGPSGEGTFRNRFNYSSCRWVHIKGLDYTLSLDDVLGYMITTDYECTSHFNCNLELLNKIHETTLWTFDNLSLGGYVVDCAQRERMGYGGDAHATTDTGLMHYRMGAFYTKWNQDWHDVQGKTASWGTAENKVSHATPEDAGNLPYTAPTYWGGGGPAWSGFCITLPWKVYLYCGDQRILEKSLPVIKRWLEFLESKSKDDMLVRWGGKWDFLGDWLWPGAQGVNGDTRETLFFNNCYWIHNLDTAAKIAAALDDDMFAQKCRKRAEKVRRAVHQEFFDPEENGYVNNLQMHLAAALLSNVPPAERRQAVWNRFEREITKVRDGHVHAGITGGYFLTGAILEKNRSDLMYKMATKCDYPSWGFMLDSEATTIWEDWEGKKSQMHSSYLWVGWWYMAGLAGIRPDESQPGFKHFSIYPGYWGTGADADDGQPSLDTVLSHYDSPYGHIHSNWQVRDGRFIMDIHIPPNTTATVTVPAKRPADLDCPDARSRTDANDYVKLMLGSGSYHFETKCPERNAR